MESIQVVVFEESAAIGDHLTRLMQTFGYQACSVNKITDLMAAFHEHNPDLLLLGPSSQPREIRAVVERVQRNNKTTPFLLIRESLSALDNEAMPENVHISIVRKNPGAMKLKQAIVGLVQESRLSTFEELDHIIVSRSPAMRQIKTHIFRLSKVDVTVLISGESGTGKELVARAIHKFSPRCAKPFIKVNTAALPGNLLESELFGFERGAFTGAFKKKPGKFELADSGTIFLDEVDKTPMTLQGKLLRILESKEFTPLGSIADKKSDVRILAATINSLDEMVRKGRFRSDLYYRLNVVHVHIPPLRKRMEDLEVLCNHFLEKYAHRRGADCRPIDEMIWERFYQYPWPGNVRELENHIRSLMVLGAEESVGQNTDSQGSSDVFSTSKTLLAPALWTSSHEFRARAEAQSLKDEGRKAAREVEIKAILDALSQTHWHRGKAAALLKISYKTLLTRIKEYGIEELSRK